MNKIGLIFRREFLNRVQKKSFLIATILVPLIFPAVIGIMIYAAIKQDEGVEKQVIEVFDESGKMQLDSSSRYKFVPIAGNIELAKEAFKQTDHFALLYVPPFELANPQGITLYTKTNAGVRKLEELEKAIENRIYDLKLVQYHIDKETLQHLKTNITLSNISLVETGEEKKVDKSVMYTLGMVLGSLIYMFVIIYGVQIMQGVIEEKSSKIVEVLISSVKPFQLMMGKILGIAAVGLVQFAIWIILIGGVTTAGFAYFGIKMPQQQAMQQIAAQQQARTPGQSIDSLQQGQDPARNDAAQQQVDAFSKSLAQIPIAKIIFNFAFFFLGGYLLYGALFAAVGSAVDSPQEAQQFTLPIMMPLIIANIGLSMFILADHDSTISFWLSIIPFTSPVAMMGRLAFDVPTWQLILSQVLLVVGFILTTWVAGRIYRVGILMSGSKVNYRVLAKWFMMKG